MNKNFKKIRYRVHGMHCASCEVLIERILKKNSGIEKVNVNHRTGIAEVLCWEEPRLDELQERMERGGYTISLWDGVSKKIPQNTFQDYVEIGMMFFLIAGLYMMASGLGLMPDFGVTENMSYGLAFIVGLVAAISSCIAVTGGLLLAVAAKYNESHSHLTGLEKFKPHLFFNAGRIASYTVLGGVVGVLGSTLSLSARSTGVITIGASVVMVILGLQVLKLFPGLQRFQPKMSKFIAHKIHDATTSQSKSAPFLLGAATFFLPCGFTQALQLYVLSTGSFKVGALTMFFFSLGTLPALLSLSAISSFAKGPFRKFFLKFSAVAIILLGIFNVNRGLALTGTNINLDFFGGDRAVEAGTKAEIVNGVQVVRMKVSGYDYYPSRFIVKQGIPVEWQIDGRGAAGCVQVVVASKLGITEYLPKDREKIIRFTPRETGVFPFSCPMGMTTPGAAFTVMPNDSGATSLPAYQDSREDDSNAQKLSLEITKEKGIYPRKFTVKKGIPVVLTINNKVKLGGCMSVMIIPKYNAATRLDTGISKFRFIPTQKGTVYATCSMGSRMVEFEVTD